MMNGFYSYAHAANYVLNFQYLKVKINQLISMWLSFFISLKRISGF